MRARFTEVFQAPDAGRSGRRSSTAPTRASHRSSASARHPPTRTSPRARGFLDVGGLTQPAPAPRFSRTQPTPRPRPLRAAVRGDTDAALTDLGLSPEEIARHYANAEPSPDPPRANAPRYIGRLTQPAPTPVSIKCLIRDRCGVGPIPFPMRPIRVLIVDDRRSRRGARRPAGRRAPTLRCFPSRTTIRRATAHRDRGAAGRRARPLLARRRPGRAWTSCGGGTRTCRVVVLSGITDLDPMVTALRRGAVGGCPDRERRPRSQVIRRGGRARWLDTADGAR